MIQLVPVNAPIELTPAVVTELTTLFITEGVSVWSQDYIKRDLLTMSHNKCCYCECKIDEESKYLEVEHYRPKVYFPSLVVTWDNLLPSCKRCNGQKGEHNTDIDPIVNPCYNNPKDYLNLKAYRFYPRNGEPFGKMTISILDLNNRRRMVKVRAEIGFAIHEELEELVEFLDEYLKIERGNKKTRRTKQIVNGVIKLLEECQPTSEYSATAATELLGNDDFYTLKEALQRDDLWTRQMTNLENMAKNVALN